MLKLQIINAIINVVADYTIIDFLEDYKSTKVKKPAYLLVTDILDAHLRMRLLQMTKGSFFFHRNSHSYWLVFVTMFSG